MAEGRRTTAGTAGPRVLRPLLLLLSALLLLGAAPAAAAYSEPALDPDATEPREGPVVVVGVPGLVWSDVSPDTTPHLWEMAGEASIGNVSIRSATSRTCPTDGWLTVSAGQRAVSERGRSTVCEPAPAPQSSGSGAFVPGFGTFMEHNRTSEFAAPVGLLGQTVSEAGGTTLAVGPGAALGAADERGHVDHYLSDPADLTTDRLDGVSLAAVELAELTSLHPDPAPASAVSEDAEPAEPDPDDVPERDREAALRIVDDRMRALMDVLPEGSALNVVGVSMDTGPSELTVGMSAGTTAEGLDGDAGYLASESTRRSGLVVLTDTTPSALSELGMQQTAPTSGRAWHATERPGTTDDAVGQLEDFNTAAVVVGAAVPGFFTGLVAFQLLTYAAAAYALSRFSGRRTGERSKRALVLSVTRVAALAAAAFPVASYLANLIPWWASAAPLAALLVCVLAADALVVAAALLGPWRHSILGPMTVVAGATAAVLLVDICLGANLQMNSPVGYSPIVAGRFYGIGNIAFAAFATGMLMAVAGIAHELIRRGMRALAVWVGLGVGAASVAIIGWPGLGTDFGGVIALVPGVAVTVMMIAGVRITVPRVAGVGALALGSIALLAWWDFLRPVNERSHFGAFAAQMADGDAATVLTRKLTSMLGTLGNWQLTLLAGCALVFLFLVLRRPTSWRIGALQRAYEDAPMLRAGLTGSLVCALVGFAANDSGVAIPAIALTVAVPLTLSACVWALQERDEETVGGSVPIADATRT